MIRIAPLAAALCAAFAAPAPAETCLSPYIKRLEGPEKVMHLWTLPVGQGSDYLAVIDVALASPSYGKLLHKIEVGSTGNEAHQIGIAGGEVQARDISNPDKIRLHDNVQGLVQANMMHLSGDGRRLYVTNSAISSIDFSPRYALRLIHVGPDGRLKQDPTFQIDFSKAPGGPARPHDMLLN